MTFITKEMHRYLELHALELQDNKIMIANHYFMNYEKYIQVLNYLNSYIKTIEEYIDRVNIKAGENIAPFVIIGSVIELQEIESQKKRVVKITEALITQEKTTPNDSCEKVSFFSELGRSLLFKEAGKNLIIEGEKGEFNYKIERVYYNLNL